MEAIKLSRALKKSNARYLWQALFTEAMVTLLIIIFQEEMGSPKRAYRSVNS